MQNLHLPSAGVLPIRRRRGVAALQTTVSLPFSVCFQVKPSFVSVSPNSVMAPKRTPAFSAQSFHDAKSSVVFVHAFGLRSHRSSTQSEKLSCAVKYSSVAAVTARAGRGRVPARRRSRAALAARVHHRKGGVAVR